MKLNESELAAKLDGVKAHVGFDEAELSVAATGNGYVRIRTNRVHHIATDVLALSRAVCEAAGLRVVETDGEPVALADFNPRLHHTCGDCRHSTAIDIPDEVACSRDGMSYFTGFPSCRWFEAKGERT